jgi:hypothetical protein
VRRLQNIIVIVLLLLWGPVTVHCGLEMDGLFGLLPTHAATSPDPHASAPPDNDPDGCAAIENGHFESLLSWFTLAAPIEQVSTIWLELSEPFPAAAENPAPVPDSSPPLELQPSWAFQRRAALPARAPNAIA